MKGGLESSLIDCGGAAPQPHCGPAALPAKAIETALNLLDWTASKRSMHYLITINKLVASRYAHNVEVNATSQQGDEELIGWLSAVLTGVFISKSGRKRREAAANLFAMLRKLTLLQLAQSGKLPLPPFPKMVLVKRLMTVATSRRTADCYQARRIRR